MILSKDFLDNVMARATGGHGFEVMPQYCIGGKQENLCRALGPGGVCMVMSALAEINGVGLYQMNTGRARELLEKFLYGQRGPSRVTPAAVVYCQARCTKADWEEIRAELNGMSKICQEEIE